MNKKFTSKRTMVSLTPREEEALEFLTDKLSTTAAEIFRQAVRQMYEREIAKESQNVN